MTYRELLIELNKLSEEQLDCDITIEDIAEEECFSAKFRIGSSCVTNNNFLRNFGIPGRNGLSDSLNENHPVIYF